MALLVNREIRSAVFRFGLIRVRDSAESYDLLQATAICYISVGHRATLLDYHQQVLHLRPDQTWQLSTAVKHM